ncbi:MAG: adenosylcobinamide-GDP ribazoletransferase [Paracoccaceae bacterium]
MTGKNDIARMQPRDIAEAIGLLTRLPVTSTGARGANAAWAWPLAGALVGAVAALAAGFTLWLGLSPWVAAGIALAAQVILTGALHEDGLADCADGFWGSTSPENRLEIMKDSQIGSYGTIALILSLLFRWSLIFSICDAGYLFGPLIAAAALSRLPMVGLMGWLTPARTDGLSQNVGRPDRETIILAGAAGLLIALFTSGLIALPGAVIAALLGWGMAKLARAKIGGQTGDVLGASQQVSEIGVLAVFSVLLA